MIKEDKVLITGHSRNLKHFLSLNYFIKVGEKIWINPYHLSKGSPSIVTCICSNCNKEVKNLFKEYYLYTNGLKDKYYCNSCKYIKSEKTSYEKYGVSNPMKNNEVKEKLKQTILNKYGVDHFSKTPNYKKTFKKTCISKWGTTNPFSNQEVKNKIKNTNLERLGVNYPMQNKDVVLKSEQTCIDNWGKKRYSETDNYKNIIDNKTKKRFSINLGNEYNIVEYINNIFTIDHKKCNTQFTTHKGLIYTRYRTNKIICTNCNPIGLVNSSLEIEVRNFLDDYNVEYVTNTKSLLNGTELDIFIPSYNVALEINGVYWHSELFKDKFYHTRKTLTCLDKGIDLIHIWEDDWLYKKDIIKSIILNRLNMTPNKIWARNCKISLIDTKNAKEFLNKNHIQGYSLSSIKIGLLYNNELVSLMTFKQKNINTKKEYELTKFCNKINYNVIGGASKLFNHFTKNNNLDTIISHVDISQFLGSIYKILGFKKLSLSKPNYYWVIDGIRENKLIYKEEKEYYKIYSTGQEKYIYTK
jgi:3D (Asp-Asp-Asp) domain-containing protein